MMMEMENAKSNGADCAVTLNPVAAWTGEYLRIVRSARASMHKMMTLHSFWNGHTVMTLPGFFRAEWYAACVY
jgi:hypothetical protein